MAEHPDQIDLSPYAYVGNNPISRTDPDGNCPMCVVWAIVEGIEALTATEVVTATVVTAGAAGTAAIISHAHSRTNNISVMQQDATISSSNVPKVAPVLKSNDTNKEEEHAEIGISKSKYPEAAQHLEDAINNGVNNKGVIDRAGANKRRKEKTSSTPTQKNKDRDEVPPAVIDNGDGSSSVRHIDPSDNRGAGASIRHQIKHLPNGTKVKVIPTE